MRVQEKIIFRCHEIIDFLIWYRHNLKVENH